MAPPLTLTLLHVGVVLLLPRQHDRGEGLVDLDQVDVVDASCPARSSTLSVAGIGPVSIDHGVDAGEGEGVEAGPRGEAELVGLLLAHDQHGGGAVGDLRRVAGGDLAVGLERRLQLGERLDGRAGADALVAARRVVGRRPSPVDL